MKSFKNKLLHSKIYWVYDKDLADKYDPDLSLLKLHIESGLIDIIQFRAKKLSSPNYAVWVSSLLDKVDFTDVLTFSNDHVQVSKDLGLDGVHIGADDMPVPQARKLLGEDALIGATARTMARALDSEKSGADYLGVGTVFSTTTKLGLITQGPEFAKSVQDSVKIPVFAIGGINSRNIGELIEQGVTRVAVASNLLNAPNSKIELNTLYKALS
ncbi:MAG: thiamine phosphate synthase [Lentisphaerales bacterium]|nr:thiamine phosphate synthase [Lentisphaerales bacterium]